MAKKTPPANEQIVLNIAPNIQVKTLNRGVNDIKTWRDAIKAAENVTNPKRAALYTLYEEVLLDGHLTAVIRKRKDRILNTRIKFVKNNIETEDENIRNILESPWFYELINLIMDARFYGHSLIEFGLGSEGVGTVELVERRNVIPELGIVALKEGETKGIPFREPPYSNWVLEVGKKKDLGLLMIACQYVIYKRGGFGDWAQFAELFGMPFRKGKYNGHDEATRIKLEEALQKSGSAAYVVLPEGSDVEFVTTGGNTAGSKDLYNGLRTACNEEMSVLILGNTMTTSDGSSRSQAEVHQDSEDDIIESDRKWVKFILNHDAKRVLVGLGLSAFADGHFVFDIAEDIDTQIKRDITLSETISQMSDGKLKADPDWFAKKYNIPVIKVADGGKPPVKK